MRRVVFEICRHDLIDEEVAGCYAFGRRILFIDVTGESFFSSWPVASIDARALSMRSLSDMRSIQKSGTCKVSRMRELRR